MKDNYLTVTALTRYITRKMDMDRHLQDLWLKGEISNFKHHSRGHMYLTIKDENSRVQAVMFAGKNRSLKFKPENGMKVLIQGNIGVYEPNGQYQLYINSMEPDGIGSLYLAYEQLKEKLQKKGYFNQEFKKNIPVYPEKIAVITSPTGAVVKDIITTIKRRYPIVEIIIIPVVVQGPNSAETIARSIEFADNSRLFDTIIVGRGGGSIEELWSFNEEIVAEAIFNAATPIISAVGHETDTTISDYVADLRAPTPTSAAELAVPSQVELLQRINTLHSGLHRKINQQLAVEKKNLHNLTTAYAFRYPAELIKQKEQLMDQKTEDLERSMQRTLRESSNKFESIYQRLQLQHGERQLRDASRSLYRLHTTTNRLMKQILDNKQKSFENTIDKLTLVNPLTIMKRGFALPYNDEGTIIKSIHETNVEDSITVKMDDGSLECRVLTKKEN